MNHAVLRCSSILLALAASGAMAGNIVHDGSLGPAKTLNGPNYTILPSDGRQVGGNLFHSFAKLNLSAGDVATFTGPTSVRNVLARVTDGTASEIDGTLRSSIPGANVFFMNPAGIVFGPNSALDIDGAFVATTADVIKLADGGKFSGDTVANNSVLSSADPSAFGFLKAQARPIVVSGNASTNSTARLITRPGKTLSIVGGDATVSSGELSAPSGRINLISVQSPGEVSGDLVSADASAADVSSFTSLGVAGINNFSSADVSGDSAGKLVVRAGTLSMDLFSLIAASAEDLDSPFSGIDLALRDSLDMSRGSIISASTSGTANGPPIRIIARMLAGSSATIRTSSRHPSRLPQAALATAATLNCIFDGLTCSAVHSCPAVCWPRGQVVTS